VRENAAEVTDSALKPSSCPVAFCNLFQGDCRASEWRRERSHVQSGVWLFWDACGLRSK
jgi:hypothetical protein